MKKKTKTSIEEFSIDLFNETFVMFDIHRDIAKVDRLYELYPTINDAYAGTRVSSFSSQNLDPFGAITAVGIRRVDKKVVCFIGFDFKYVEGKTGLDKLKVLLCRAAHEAVHATDYVFEKKGIIGQDFSDNNETFTYMVEFIFDKCQNYIMSRYENIKVHERTTNTKAR